MAQRSSAAAPRTPAEPRRAEGATRRAARRRALWILGIWTFVGLLRATQRYLRGRQLELYDSWAWRYTLEANLMLAYLWAAATPLVMRLARRFPIGGTPLRVLVPVHLLAGAAVSFLHALVTNVLYKLLLAPEVSWSAFLENFLRAALLTGPSRFSTYLVIVGVTWGIDSYRTEREKAIRASALQAELAEARLDALKLQLHPAFVFNALNTLLPLIYRDPAAAARTVVQLGDLLRLSLKNEATKLVALHEELELLELYLQIERTRLQDRLTLRFRIQPEALTASVPNLILQPLAEAAIAQGVSARPGLGRIEIRARREADELIVEVHDEGPQVPESPAFEPDRAETDGFLRTRRRLEHLYPNRHRLQARARRHGWEVTLAIPFSTAAAPSKPRRAAKAGAEAEPSVAPRTVPGEALP